MFSFVCCAHPILQASFAEEGQGGPAGSSPGGDPPALHKVSIRLSIWFVNVSLFSIIEAATSEYYQGPSKPGENEGTPFLSLCFAFIINVVTEYERARGRTAYNRADSPSIYSRRHTRLNVDPTPGPAEPIPIPSPTMQCRLPCAASGRSDGRIPRFRTPTGRTTVYER